MQLALSFEQKKVLNQKFKEALDKLNDHQRRAVETTEGPVMVLAGPGTGKTETIALRIGYILQTTDARAHNLLCLTYTEAGALAMRERLLKYIGPEAYQVSIFTFHAFCNQIIQDNRSLFGEFRDLRPVSDLELVDVYRDLLLDLPAEHPLRRLSGQRFFDLPRFKNLFEYLKRENKSYAQLEQEVRRREEEMLQDAEYVLKKASGDWKAGDLNHRGRGKMEKYHQTLLAAALLPDYNRRLRDLDRYDFSDMILWVLEAFQQKPEFIAYYQEKYLYILVDEFQDTNGAQNQILTLLASYWERPNLFVVGDDDQAIFRFQGANMDNMLSFMQHYQPEPIVLTHNYRSTQPILNWSSKLIAKNSQRLVNFTPHLRKELIGSSGHAHKYGQPVIRQYQNTAQEEADVLRQIKALHAQGVRYGDMAVIYRKHQQGENLIKACEYQGIPVNARRKIDVLQFPFIVNLVSILQYIHLEGQVSHSGEWRLFEIMHYAFWDLEPSYLARIAVHIRLNSSREKPLYWREILADEALLRHLGFKDLTAIQDIRDALNYGIKYQHSLTLQNLVEKVVQKCHLFRFIMESDEKIWNLQLLTSLFEFIKQESDKKPDLSLGEFLQMMDKMRIHHLPLALTKISFAQDGVNFMTAHGAKGLEFEQVFFIGNTRNTWESRSYGADRFELPYDDQTDDIHGEEDERRLFFVAMTRAKKALTISYAVSDVAGRDQEKSGFVAELMINEDIEPVLTETPADDILTFYQQLISPDPRTIDLLEKNYIDQVLQGLQLNATAVNKYLKCPLTYYFENILRVPQARAEHLGFGNAIHQALEDFFRQEENITADDNYGRLIQVFRQAMVYYQAHFTPEEFSDRLVMGEQMLRDYLKQHLLRMIKPERIVVEQKIAQVHWEDIPLTGILDKVEIYKDRIEIIDYKTGKYENAKPKLSPPKERMPQGGDYWRQMVFYKILIDQDPMLSWSLSHGYFDFIQADEKGELRREKIQIRPEDEQLVKEQIKQVWTSIKAYKFQPGCNQADCTWCNFVKRHYELPGLPEQEEWDD